MLREIPPYQDVLFEPLQMTDAFSSSIQIPSETDINSAYGLFKFFSLFISEESIALLSTNTNKYAKAKDAGQTGRD
jgi:hypothetical protein